MGNFYVTNTPQGGTQFSAPLWSISALGVTLS
jgi:hypothetical protein